MWRRDNQYHRSERGSQSGFPLLTPILETYDGPAWRLSTRCVQPQAPRSFYKAVVSFASRVKEEWSRSPRLVHFVETTCTVTVLWKKHTHATRQEEFKKLMIDVQAIFHLNITDKTDIATISPSFVCICCLHPKFAGLLLPSARKGIQESPLSAAEECRLVRSWTRLCAARCCAPRRRGLQWGHAASRRAPFASDFAPREPG